jgi:arylsulfatase A-like enzyme
MSFARTRRQVVGGFLAGSSLLLLAPYASAAAARNNPKRPDKPNILFILADDLGYADVSCYGRQEYLTPAIDRLAREGVRYTHAYANSAVCSATRVGLITGRYQNRLPVGLEEPLASRDLGLDPSHPTLPSLLRERGYDTSLIGKWHLGKLPKYGPSKSGYDHFWGFRGGGVDYFTHAGTDGKPDLWDNDRQVERPGYMTDLLGERARETIRRCAAADKPFFISLHFNAPHWPWEGPNDEEEAKRIAAEDDPTRLFDYKGGSMATFAAMVTRMDEQIGRILAELDRLGLAEDTIIVFTSDNGGERYSNTWPFTGKKTELLEGGIRIPAILRWPRRVKGGRVSDQVTMSMDWMPTLLQAAGTQPHPKYPSDGIDLTPTFSAGNSATHRTVCWRYLNMGQRACRDGDLKYLKILGNEFLFNVVNDPLERANLKDRYPTEFQRLKTLWNDWDSMMLPLDVQATTSGTTGAHSADHFGISQSRTVPEE